MVKHRKDMPVVGTGKSYGNGPKPGRGQVTVKSSTGTVLWKSTVALFSKKKGK